MYKRKRRKKGKFEWYPEVVKNKFTSSSHLVTFKTEAGHELICADETSSGEYSGTKKLAHVVLTFHGCEAAGKEVENEPCATTGAGAGEVVSKELEGTLGWEKDTGPAMSEKKVALDLVPVAGQAKPFMECSIGRKLAFVVSGSVLGRVAYADKMEITPLVKYIGAAKAKQKPEHFEGEPNDVLETSFEKGAGEASGLSLEMTQKPEEQFEINAIV